MARPGGGKSGGYRYLYLWLERHGVIYLLFLFAKNDQGNLTASQRKGESYEKRRDTKNAGG